MQAITGYPDPGALSTEPVGWVYWRNQTLPASSITVSRSLGAGLPSQVAGTDDMVASEATVVVSTKGLVTEGLHSPWDTGLPQLGDAVDVYSGLMDKSGVRRERRILRGRVDSVDGDVSDPSVTVKVIDRVDRLKKSITVDPLNYRMPPHTGGGSERRIGLHPTYLTDRIARRCGFYATPQKEAGAWVSVPMVGSVWPEWGELEYSTATGANVGGNPSFYGASWGLGVTNVMARYKPVLRPEPGPLGLALRYPTYVRFLVDGPMNGGRGRIILRWPNDHTYHIRVTAAQGLVVARFDTAVADDVDPLTSTNYFQMPLPAGSELLDELDVSVWLSPADSTTTGSNLAVRAQINSTVLEGAIWAPTTVKSEALEQVRVYSDGEGGAIGGVQVGSNLSVYDLHAWSRTALYETDYDGYWNGVPALVNEDCLSLLKAQAKSTLAALWLDEDGRLRFRSRKRLLNAAPVETITVSSIRALSWRRSWDSVAELVRCEYKMPEAVRGRGIYATQDLWDAGQQQIPAGDLLEIFASPDADDDWIQVEPMLKLPTTNVDPQDVQALAQIDQFKRGIGSWASGVSEEPGNPDSTAPVPRSWYDIGFWKIDPKTYRVTMKNLYTDRYIVTRSPDWAGWALIRRNVPTPKLRGHMIQHWNDLTATSATVGVADTGEYVHDGGWWVQYETHALALADYLAGQMANPTPVYEAVEVAPDDRRQLGDVVTLDDGFYQKNCLILSIEDDYPAPGERTQVLSLKPIS